MTVADTDVELSYLAVVVNVPIVVGIQNLGDVSHVQVTYGSLKQLATQGVDYTVVMAPDMLSFTVTPLAALMTKIALNGTNVIYASRVLPLTTDFDLDDAFVREKLVANNDKIWMTLQQVRHFSAVLGEFVGDLQAAAISAAAALVSETAAAASAAAALASQTAAAVSAAAALVSQNAAAASAATATTQASNASISAGTATTQAGIATVQAGNAAASAVTASTQAGNAAASAAAALVSQNAASVSAAAALVSQNAAAASAANAAADAIAAGNSFKNFIHNGNGAINQRVAGAGIADDVYGHDRWYALTQTAAITVSTQTDVANGVPFMWRLSQQQVTAQRMGYAQILESVDVKQLRGQLVTLNGKLRCSASQALRYAILEWTGTADAPVSDIVNSWTNATFTAGQFFNSTTLNVLAVGTITPAANTLTDFSLAATIGASANNVIVFIWTEAVAAQNVTLDGAVWLKPGTATGVVLEYRPRQVELAICQRYFWRVNLGVTQNVWIGQAQGTTAVIGAVQHPVVMRTVPTGVITGMSYNISGSPVDCSSASVADITAYHMCISGTTTGLTNASGLRIGGRSVGTDYISASAEL